MYGRVLAIFLKIIWWIPTLGMVNSIVNQSIPSFDHLVTEEGWFKEI